MAYDCTIEWSFTHRPGGIWYIRARAYGSAGGWDFVPGYESRNSSDIIGAMLYLQQGYRWKIDGRQEKILDGISRRAHETLGV